MTIELTDSLLLAYGATLISATLPILIGSYVSLSQTATETMSSKDAYMFPVIGSCVLFGLYLAFQFFSKEYVNLLLTAYFLLFSISALTATLSSFLSSLLRVDEKNNFKFNLSLPFRKKPIEFDFNMVDVFSLVVSVVFGGWYAMEKHWIANNLFGFSFSVQGISLISPGSYSIACIMLSGLFFYDIFWVFGTDVMVTVAKSFDGPIKLLFPKNFFVAIETGVPFEFSMLGLGDIVIPGIFIALLLRFDVHQKNSGKPNFYVCLISYFLGLLTTIAVMHIFEHPQPALLYLVPFCIISSFTCALLRGELSALLAYSESDDEKDDEKKKNENCDKDKKDEKKVAKKE